MAILIAGFFVIAAATTIFWTRVSQTGWRVQHSVESTSAAHLPRRGAIVTAGAHAAPFQLTPQQRRGKQIYLTGISPTGAKMTAVLGNSTTEVPAAMLTCVNCHRHDGRGKPEGGIYPSNIRWDELTKPYGSSGPRGRRRPPYDESMLKRSISMGLDPAGKMLDDAMPRYRMTHQDLADLAAYLMVIGQELDPGLSADRIRIGVILAPQDLFPDLNRAVRAAVSAYVSKLNRDGGVYQRQIELCFAESPARREDRAAAAFEFIHREGLFALASTFIAGDEVEIARQLGEEGVPLVGAQTLYPQLAFPLNRHVFYLVSGLVHQNLALVNYALKVQGGERQANRRGNAVLLIPEADESSGAHLDSVASAIEAHCAHLGCQTRTHRIRPAEFHAQLLARNLKEQQVACVFSLLSGQQNLRLLAAANGCEWFPRCYLPSLVGAELFDAPKEFNKKIFLSFPTLPSRQSTGMREYHELAQAHKLPAVHLSTQFEALSAVKVLVEGLHRVGSDVSRERLVEKLETLYEHRTGFTPSLTFGPNRRVGARGAYILAIDLANRKLDAVSDWVDAS